MYFLVKYVEKFGEDDAFALLLATPFINGNGGVIDWKLEVV